MNELMKEIRAYAKAVGKKPSTIVQEAGKCGGQAWAKWLKGGTCSMKISDRIRKYIKDNPPEALK